MDLSYSKDEMEFREEVRDFFQTAVPKETRRKLLEGRHLSKEDMVTWQRILNKKGWAVPHWPVQWGGTGWDSVRLYIYNEEMQLAPAPQPLAFNTSMLGPVLYNVASEEQKKYYLPRIANLDDWWCQGFSEPGAGSDLASLKTKAERKGDVYVVNGQKTWTTLAQNADMIFCLVRTDPNAKNRQSGISFLLIDMKSRGITVRPIVTIDGGREVNEVFFDNVEVPIANLVGQENKGWDYAKFLLGNERTGIARIGASKERLRRIRELAAAVKSDGRPIIEDPRFLEKLDRGRDRAQGARDEPDARRRRGKTSREGQAGSGLVHSQDQGVRAAAGHHRVDDGGDRSVRAPFESDDEDGSNEVEEWTTPDRAELLQLPQGLDLRRFERNSAQHHRQGGAGAVTTVAR